MPRYKMSDARPGVYYLGWDFLLTRVYGTGTKPDTKIRSFRKVKKEKKKKLKIKVPIYMSKQEIYLTHTVLSNHMCNKVVDKEF